MTNTLMMSESTGPPLASVRTVLICDEEPYTRRTLGHRLGGPSGTVVATVADGIALLNAFARRPADVVLIGVHRGTRTGTRAIDLLLGPYPTATVIAFGSTADASQLSAALTSGACGLMLWNNNGRYGPVEPGRPATSRLGGSRAVLTDRELQVLRSMSEGKSNRSTGKDLFLTEDTIKTHARALFLKLGARDRAHAVALGLRYGHLQ